MHCPENVDGNAYVELVAAVSILLSQNRSALDTFVIAELLQSISCQMLTIATFKEFEEKKKPPLADIVD